MRNHFLNIIPILFAVTCLAIGSSLLIILLPIKMSMQNINVFNIGIAMSSYAAGQLLSGIWGGRIITRIGHIRVFASMASSIAIIALVHSMLDNFYITMLLRLLAGFCFVNAFISLESWLSATSDKKIRGRVYSIYQICYGLGFGMSPLLFNLWDSQDIRIFLVISIVLCVSLLPLAMSSRVNAPAPPEGGRVSFTTLWSISPIGFIGVAVAGLVFSPIVSLTSIYVKDLNTSGWIFTILLSSAFLGSLIVQYPTGWLADSLKKSSIINFLMFAALTSHLLIITNYFLDISILLTALGLLLGGGFAAAIFPISATEIFDKIETSQMPAALGTAMVIYGISSIISPIIVSFLMQSIGNIWMFYYLVVIHISVIIFCFVKARMDKNIVLPNEEINEEAQVNYQVNTQPVTQAVTSFDPRFDYSLKDINQPEIQVLLAALRDNNLEDPKQLILTTLEVSPYTPEQLVLDLVVFFPRKADVMIEIIISLFPEKRLDFVRALYDFYSLRKIRIEELVLNGLIKGATIDEEKSIREEIESIIDHVSDN